MTQNTAYLANKTVLVTGACGTVGGELVRQLLEECTVKELIGYDNNESELYEIPEVMNWLSESIKKGIPWFYFLSLDFKASTLKLLLYSYCGIGKKELIGDRYLVSFNGEKLKSFIDINFTNMNIFMQKYGLSIELNKQISSKILEVLESGMKETDPFPKPKIN